MAAEGQGSSLRFEAAETYNLRHGLAADVASQKLRAALKKGRQVLPGRAGTVAVGRGDEKGPGVEARGQATGAEFGDVNVWRNGEAIDT